MHTFGGKYRQVRCFLQLACLQSERHTKQAESVSLKSFLVKSVELAKSVKTTKKRFEFLKRYDIIQKEEMAMGYVFSQITQPSGAGFPHNFGKARA